MSDIEVTLKNASSNIGRHVVYTPYKGCSASCKEFGIITSVNDKYVFVRYTNDLHSKATNPNDLTYE